MIMRQGFVKVAAVFMAALILFSSCASSTVFRTTPEGAKVYADGQYLGTTPVTYSDTKIVGSSTNIRIEKEGYKTVNAVLNRSEQADIGAIVGGLFVWIPFLWTMKYNAEHNYEMEPLNGSAPVHHVADTAK